MDKIWEQLKCTVDTLCVDGLYFREEEKYTLSPVRMNGLQQREEPAPGDWRGCTWTNISWCETSWWTRSTSPAWPRPAFLLQRITLLAPLRRDVCTRYLRLANENRGPWSLRRSPPPGLRWGRCVAWSWAQTKKWLVKYIIKHKHKHHH